MLYVIGRNTYRMPQEAYYKLFQGTSGIITIRSPVSRHSNRQPSMREIRSTAYFPTSDRTASAESGIIPRVALFPTVVYQRACIYAVLNETRVVSFNIYHITDMINNILTYNLYMII